MAPTNPPRTAFALAGAGTKGAFEVGALTYLVREAEMAPDAITATSAGAILGSILAQARGRIELLARLDDLRNDLLAMSDTGVVFAKQPWLAELDGTPLGRAVDDFITVRNRPPVPPDPDDPDEPDDGSAAAHRRPRRHHHRLHGLALLVEQLPAAVRAGHRLPDSASSLLTLEPLGRALRGSGPFAPIDPTAVARPGVDLRLTVTALGAGVTHYVDGAGHLLAADATTPVGDQQVDLIDAVLASSSVPMVFPPHELAGEAYVDGGVLQNIPVEAAVATEAERIVAVLGVPLAVPVDERDFSRANLLGIYLRCTGPIAFAARQHDNLAAALHAGRELVTVAPTLDVVGPFEVEQGLMLVDVDYGWLRAAEVVAGADASTTDRAFELSDAATAARERAWFAEEHLWRAGSVDAAGLAAIGRAKRQVRAAVAARDALGFAAPPDVSRWWTAWEHHSGEAPVGLPDDATTLVD